MEVDEPDPRITPRPYLLLPLPAPVATDGGCLLPSACCVRVLPFGPAITCPDRLSGLRYLLQISEIC